MKKKNKNKNESNKRLTYICIVIGIIFLYLIIGLISKRIIFNDIKVDIKEYVPDKYSEYDILYIYSDLDKNIQVTKDISKDNNLKILNQYYCETNICNVLNNDNQYYNYLYIQDGKDYIIFNYIDDKYKRIDVNGTTIDKLIFDDNNLMAIITSNRLYSINSKKIVSYIDNYDLVYDSTNRANSIIALQNKLTIKLIDLYNGVSIMEKYSEDGNIAFSHSITSEYNHYIVNNYIDNRMDIYNDNVALVASTSACKNCQFEFNDNGEILKSFIVIKNDLEYYMIDNVTTSENVYISSKGYKKILQIFKDNRYLAVIDQDNVIKIINDKEKVVASFYEWNDTYVYNNNFGYIYNNNIQNEYDGLYIYINIIDDEIIDGYEFSYNYKDGIAQTKSKRK